MGRRTKCPELSLAMLGALLSEGRTQKWIANEYGLSQATVSRRVTRLRGIFERMQNDSASNTQSTASGSASSQPPQQHDE